MVESNFKQVKHDTYFTDKVARSSMFWLTDLIVFRKCGYASPFFALFGSVVELQAEVNRDPRTVTLKVSPAGADEHDDHTLVLDEIQDRH